MSLQFFKSESLWDACALHFLDHKIDGYESAVFSSWTIWDSCELHLLDRKAMDMSVHLAVLESSGIHAGSTF